MTDKKDISEEFADVKVFVKNAALDLKDNIRIQAPPQISTLFTKAVNSPALAWFFIGTGFEALGLTLQYVFVGVSYPILDFVCGAGIGVALLVYQKRKEDKLRRSSKD